VKFKSPTPFCQQAKRRLIGVGVQNQRQNRLDCRSVGTRFVEAHQLTATKYLPKTQKLKRKNHAIQAKTAQINRAKKPVAKSTGFYVFEIIKKKAQKLNSQAAFFHPPPQCLVVTR